MQNLAQKTQAPMKPALPLHRLDLPGLRRGSAGKPVSGQASCKTSAPK